MLHCSLYVYGNKDGMMMMNKVIHIMSLTYSHSLVLDRDIDDQNTIDLLETLCSHSATLIRQELIKIYTCYSSGLVN